MQHYAQITYFQPIHVAGVHEKIYAIYNIIYRMNPRKHGADVFSQKAPMASNPSSSQRTALLLQYV